MTLPISTTTVTIARTDGTGDPYEAAAVTTVASGVSAHVSAPSGSAAHVGGDQEIVDAVLYVPLTPALSKLDVITDAATGKVWQVRWTRQRVGVGLDHQIAGVNAVSGASNG